MEDYDACVDTLNELKVQTASRGVADLVDVVESIRREMRHCHLCKATHPLNNTQDKRASRKEEPDSQALGVDSSDEDPSLGQTRVHGRSVLVEDWKQATLGRFPRPKVGPHIAKLPLQKIRWKEDFDDYFDAPSDEAILNLKVHGLAFQASLAYVLDRSFITPSSWSAFRDYGYRLGTDFGQAFDLKKPVMVAEHICPVALEKPPRSIMDYRPSLHVLGRHGRRIEVNDFELLGLQELLWLADREHSDNVLTTGRTKMGDYVGLDLLKDCHSDVDVVYSCDIDSLIWLTKYPSFKGPVSIYMTPLIRRQAPIWKDNQLGIHVIKPEPEGEQQVPRSHWHTAYFPLSKIPHISIGTLSALLSAEILIFFPRAIHQDPHHGYYVNRVPSDVQEFFWDEVLLPALTGSTPVTQEPYIATSRSHAKFKQGRHKGNQPCLVTIGPPQINKFFNRMEQIVR
jgi:hypothetical protein